LDQDDLADTIDLTVTGRRISRAQVQTSGSAFGWPRFTLAQPAAALAAPTMAARDIVPVGRLGVEAVVYRAVHELSSSEAFGHYALEKPAD